jgi:hypothetical protein
LTTEISPYIIYGWKFHFEADLDSLQMYGPAAGGTFAYVCYVIDGQGRTVGQGRGMAELREPQMLNANKAVKMALKRAQVDAVLRCAGLSQWFTQDLEEPPYIAPGAAAVDGAGPAPSAEPPPTPEPPKASGYRQYLRDRLAAQEQAGSTPSTPPACTPQQQHLLRRWLQRTGRSEEEILRHYGLARLEELPALTANCILERLIRLDHDARQVRRRDGGNAEAR